MRLPILILLAAFPLAACGKGDGGTSVTIKDERGKTVASADGGNGDVKLDVPGLNGKITLPKIKLDADSFDLNGVHLYPGSTINDFNIQAGVGKDGVGKGGVGKGGAGNGGVQVTFTSPAEPSTVRDWLAERLNKADFQVRPDGAGPGAGLIGTTDEKQPFHLTLSPVDDHHARGVLTIG